ncbi:MAG TPA: class II glutamine amidotransferase, partial [Solirubrobacteraceae bacterium]|nr:class II glutamine amidotransferase [Solirubrobacteraceae bacterium]
MTPAAQGGRIRSHYGLHQGSRRRRRGAAFQAPARAHRPEPALAARRRADQDAGFGVGWYGAGEGPGVFRSVLPAWGDANLRHLARDIESPLFLSYVRATSGPPIQETNCHPFSHGRWLFVHNGAIADFRTLRRDLMLAVAPELIADIQGSTDSEVLFHLALSHGSRTTARSARMRDRFRGGDRRAHAVEFPFQGSVGVSDGETLWALRYPSEGRSRSLFASADVEALHKLHP